MAMTHKVYDNVTQRLNQKNKELVRRMDELGYTSLGYEGTYLVKGRTIYMNPRFGTSLGYEKIATFTKATLEQVEKDIVKDINETIEYFEKSYEAKKIKGLQNV